MSITVNDLYNLAHAEAIEIKTARMPNVKSMSAMFDGEYWIGIDPFELTCEADEKVKLAHEVGHCVTGSFYNIYSKFDIKSRHEYKANKWAIKKLIPKSELERLVNKKGITTAYELAEEFGVTQEFMETAVRYYRDVIDCGNK